MSDEFKPVGLLALVRWVVSHFKDDTKYIDQVLQPPVKEVEGNGHHEPRVSNRLLKHKVQVANARQKRSDRHH